MVGFLAMPKTAYHVRSISLPSGSHLIGLRVEEQLQQLKVWETSSSSHCKTKMLRNGLDGLRILCNCVEDLLQSPQTQKIIDHNGHQKWVDEVLDGSVGMLDVCGTMRDAFLQMKETVKDLQSALRRRRGAEENFPHKVEAYMSLKKKMQKKIDKSLRSLKKMESKCDLSTLVDKDQSLATTIKVLEEVQFNTIKIFEALLSFVSSSRPATKLSLASKWMGNKRVASESEVEKMNEMERMDAFLYAHRNKSSRDRDMELMQCSQTHLQEAIASIQVLEDGLDSLYRSLIETRVSLLNIINH